MIGGTVRDDTSPQTIGYSLPAPRDLTARRHGSSLTAHASMMLDFYSARDAWRQDRQDVTLGWATETAEYDAVRPAPRLVDFMKGRAS